MTRNGRGKHHILRPRPYSFCSGGFSLLPSSVLSARITSCTCASNFCVSCSHPVKSAASRDSTGLALPLVHFPQQIPVQVQRNHLQHFSLALFHQFAFFGKRAINLIVHPPTRQRVPRATQQHLVPQPNPAVYLFVNVTARQHLLLIHPAPHIRAEKPQVSCPSTEQRFPIRESTDPSASSYLGPRPRLGRGFRTLRRQC